MTQTLPERFIERARRLGFTPPRIARLSEMAKQSFLKDFVAQGFHGQMAWMEDTLERRLHPNNLWAGAKSAIVLGMNYGPDTDPLVTLEQQSKATISVYARNRDYHDIIKGRLKELAGLLAQDLGTDVKVFVDTAPLMEKPLAQLAGLGWQGKHTNLVSRDLGSWLFIATILTEAELEPDEAEIDHCGSCRACLDICPTDAFEGPYRLDARKCISYLTIEHDGPVDRELRVQMGNRIYGCDDCLAVCPWNKFAQGAHEAKLQARDDLMAPDLGGLAVLDDAAFRDKFKGSPIKRIGRNRFIRNVLYAIGNSGNRQLAGAVAGHLGDISPMVRGAAVWALERLGLAAEYGEMAADELDDMVLEEWLVALGANTDSLVDFTPKD